MSYNFTNQIWQLEESISYGEEFRTPHFLLDVVVANGNGCLAQFSWVFEASLFGHGNKVPGVQRSTETLGMQKGVECNLFW